MAHNASAPPRVSFAKRWVKFTNSSGGLDLTLRLIQALALIATEICIDTAIVAQCDTAVMQLAMGRRYLRFFAFIDCFELVRDLLTGELPSNRGVWKTMQIAEVSGLGLYLLMESATMLHDMNVWVVSWYLPWMIEANKFWFYAICLSIARSIGKLWLRPAAPSKAVNEKKGASKKASAPPAAPSTGSLLKRIVIDICDLTLPATFIGWVSPGNAGVGLAMVVSTLLAAHELWKEMHQ